MYLSYFRARAARRPAGVHSLVRPRARRRARPCRRRRRARDLPLPLRRAAGARGLPAERALLPALVAAVQTVTVAPAAEGGRAPRGHAVLVPRPHRRLAPPMAR